MAATTITRASLTDSTSPITGDLWNAGLVGTALYDKIDALLTGSTLRQERSSSGPVSFTVASASNTSGSDAILQALVAGTSGGDAQLVLVITSGSTWSLGIDNSDADKLKITNAAATGANTFVIDTAGNVYVGDNSNANMTLGLTINQAGNDDEILALKSSDVAHGITTATETDTFFSIRKASTTSGGGLLTGYTSDACSVKVEGISTVEDATRSTAATAVFVFNANKKSGTSAAALAANQNMVCFANGAAVRFIFDSDGDSHQDVGTTWTTFDGEDDVAVLNLLTAFVTRETDPLRSQFGQWLEKDRMPLEQLRLVAFNEDGHHFVNMSRLTMLLTGAARQLGARLDLAERTVETLHARVLALGA